MRASLAISLSLAMAAGLPTGTTAQDKSPSSAKQEDDKTKAPQEDMQSLLATAKQYIAPGKNHKELERFLGTWDVETRIFMGGKSGPPGKGSAEFSWLMPGRWLQGRWKGTMMGMPMEGYSIMGYDNFKRSYVTVSVSDFDTAMNHSEGDMDPSGQALLTYGTMDEYLTGEHDKMVRYVWRFPSTDKIVLEVHDLPIGENNTKVVEIVYTRAAAKPPATAK